MEKAITDWIKEHKHIVSVSSIEKETGMPPHTLQKVMQGKRKLPQKWENVLLDYIDKVTEQWVFPGKPILGTSINWDRASRLAGRKNRKKRNDYYPNISNIVACTLNDLDGYKEDLEKTIQLIESVGPPQYNSGFVLISHMRRIDTAIKLLNQLRELITPKKEKPRVEDVYPEQNALE